MKTMNVEDAVALALGSSYGDNDSRAKVMVDILKDMDFHVCHLPPTTGTLMVGEPFETTRDRFAMHALGLMMRDGTDLLMSVLAAGEHEGHVNRTLSSVAKMAYRMADAMETARDETTMPQPLTPIWSTRPIAAPAEAIQPCFVVLCPDNVWRSCEAIDEVGAVAKMGAAWEAGKFEAKPAPLGI